MRGCRERAYNYAELFMPHDVAVRELSTGSPRTETLDNLRFDHTVLQQARIEDGIHTARLLLPKCWFDATRCEEGLDKLDRYRRVYDSKRSVFLKQPLHDSTSHAADSFRYLAQGLDVLVGITDINQADAYVTSYGNRRFRKPRVNRSVGNVKARPFRR